MKRHLLHGLILGASVAVLSSCRPSRIEHYGWEDPYEPSLNTPPGPVGDPEATAAALIWMRKCEKDLERDRQSAVGDKAAKKEEDLQKFRTRVAETEEFEAENQRRLARLPELTQIVRRQNALFRKTVMQGCSLPDADVEMIIQAVEATDPWVEKRIRSFRILDRRTVEIFTGIGKPLAGHGYIFTLKKTDGGWKIVAADPWLS